MKSTVKVNAQALVALGRFVVEGSFSAERKRFWWARLLGGSSGVDTGARPFSRAFQASGEAPLPLLAYLDAVLFENVYAFLAFRVAYLQHAEDKRDQANCCARHIGGACSCCRCGFGCHALSQRACGDACHKGHDKRRAQTAGNLATGVGDCVAMGDFVIGKRIDAPCVYGHVRERLPHGLSRAKHGYEHDG